ncbi:calcium/sodium antiporter [bacterium]|nr:calcium/sodium antiporter [bacterium]
MLLNIILLIIGFVILIKGADYFVEGASSIAGNLHVPKILIGLTIVAFGTSAPEFAVSIKSILAGSGDIVLGNVIGSNILNIVLILGCSALFHSLQVQKNTAQKELPMMLLLTALFSVLLCDNLFDVNATNAFTRTDAAVVLMFFAVFLYYLFSLATGKKDKTKEKYLPLGKALLFTIGGIVGIILGSNFVVDSASALATALGVSEKLIAMTIVALGTSLPELVTSITATRRGEYDLALGNVIGSNIFNIGVVLGIPVALFGDISHLNFNYVDIGVMLLVAFLLFIFATNNRQITKREGIVFLGVFFVYYGYLLCLG